MRQGQAFLAGLVWLVPVAALATDPAPASCVAQKVEPCVATMKNVFSTVEQTRAYCTKAAQQSCDDAAKVAK